MLAHWIVAQYGESSSHWVYSRMKVHYGTILSVHT
jgi:hypothetical protein